MITYVESNFVLEIALGQEQSADAERILNLAEEERILLAIPTFGLSEPFSRLRQRTRDRKQVVLHLHQQIQDLTRSNNYRQFVETLQQVRESMVRIEHDEMNRLVSVVERVLNVSDVVPITSDAFRDSAEMQTEFGLEPEDALVLANVVGDLKTRDLGERKCYVSRDFKAFSDPGIKSILDELNCRYISTFSDAVSYIVRFTP